MKPLYLSEVEPCYCCGRETKRVNMHLELPSCSVRCDQELNKENETDGAN